MYTPLRRLLFAGVIAISLLQSACGQKGDLYLPEIPVAPNVMSGRPTSQATSTLEDQHQHQEQQEQSDEEKRKASAKKTEADAKAQAQPETQDSN